MGRFGHGMSVFLLFIPLVHRELPTVQPLNSLGIMRGPIIGYGIAALGLNWFFDINTVYVRQLLCCSYGIYLAHFGFLEIFEFVAEELGWSLTPYSIITKILVSSLICLCCVLFIAVARSNRLAAYLLLGEYNAPRKSDNKLRERDVNPLNSVRNKKIRN